MAGAPSTSTTDQLLATAERARLLAQQLHAVAVICEQRAAHARDNRGASPLGSADDTN